MTTDMVMERIARRAKRRKAAAEPLIDCHGFGVFVSICVGPGKGLVVETLVELERNHGLVTLKQSIGWP